MAKKQSRIWKIIVFTFGTAIVVMLMVMFVQWILDIHHGEGHHRGHLEARPPGGGRQARSEQDIRAVARAQGELRNRVAQLTGLNLGSSGNSPGRSGRRRGGAPLPGEGGEASDVAGAAAESLLRAGEAMERAEGALNALKTSGALPHEMEALNQLLKLDAEVRRREVARQQNGQGQGSGGSRGERDLSVAVRPGASPAAAEQLRDADQRRAQRPVAPDGRPRQIRNLARRQEQFAQELADLAKRQAQLSAEELKRRLETLTREQSELRRQAEELSRQLSQQQQAGQQQSGQQQAGQQQAGQQQASGQQSGQASQSGGGRVGQSMRGVSQEMTAAASELRRQDPAQAARRSEQALERLRQLEQEVRNSRPDERRRAMGDLQFETRQLADAQRQVASEADDLPRTAWRLVHPLTG